MSDLEEEFAEEGLFETEQEVLHHSQDIIMAHEHDPEELLWEYKYLSQQYSKLLRLSQKVVQLGDAAQRKLLETNALVEEKVAKLTLTEEKLTRISTTDDLTNLPNRRGAYKKLDEMDRNFRERHIPFSLFIIDIDHFKSVNDTYGHSTGDKVLQIVSETMRSAIRKQDYLGRWGGEEFLLLLPETDCQGSLILAEKMRKTIEATPVDLDGENVTVTISGGGCCLKEDMEVSQCLELADKALYNCKHSGRNKVALHED